jgi:taurine dioxygenase
MERFGKVEPHPLGSRRGVDQHPQVMILENHPGKPGPRNDIWHSDISYDEVPPAASMLHALTVTDGYADTMFCNMYAAYEELSPGLKRVLDGLKAMHTAELLVLEVPSRLSVKEAPPAVEHPAVRTHPETGRRALYVNPWYTSHFSGWTAEESKPLLDYLFQRATRHENIYRHKWRVGDVLMWDNRSAMHYGVKDYDDGMPRLMHRVTASGDKPR